MIDRILAISLALLGLLTLRPVHRGAFDEVKYRMHRRKGRLALVALLAAYLYASLLNVFDLVREEILDVYLIVLL